MTELLSPPTRDVLFKLAGGDEGLLRKLEDLFVLAGDSAPSAIEQIIIELNEIRQEPNPLSRLLATLKNKQDYVRAITEGQIVFVSDKYDFPVAIGGVITLVADTIYYITAKIDLKGDVLEAGGVVAILSATPEIGQIKSTGKPTLLPMLKSIHTIAINNIGFHDSNYALSLNGSGADPVLDWRGVNFSNCSTMGDISNYNNSILVLLGILGSANLVFDGTFGTIKFTNTLFSGISSETTISIASTAIITRRIDIFDCAFSTPTGGTGLDVNTSATIPDEGYILRNCNFSGAGTDISGVQHDDDKSLFVDNKGIDNSTQKANYYMIGNATSTSITSGTPVKLLGTTTLDPVTERFTHTNNRATYTGAITRQFSPSVTAAFVSNNNNVLDLYIAKNGVVIAQSIGTSTANAGGRAEFLFSQALVSLATGDFIEAWADNQTGNNAITAENLNMIITEST